MPSLSTDELRKAQLNDAAIARVRVLVEKQLPLTAALRHRETREVVATLRGSDKLYFRQGVMYKEAVIAGTPVMRYVVPSSLCSSVYQGVHDEMGHLASERGIALVRSRFYWFRLDDDIQAYCKRCTPCMLHKAPAQRAANMMSLESGGPMDLLCIDFLKVEPDRYNRTDILVVTESDIVVDVGVHE